MARHRTIKPTFWTDGDVMDLSAYARLLFIGTWNFALCDYGHVSDDPRRLKAQILPNDDVDPTALVDELLNAGRLTRITLTDGRTFLHITRFTDHQKLDRRWSPRCPACRHLAETHQTPPELPDTPPLSPQDRTGQDRTNAAAAALRAPTREKPPPPPLPVDHQASEPTPLPGPVEILRSRLETRNLHVRWDKLNPTQLADIEALITVHSDARLVKAAMNTYRPDDPPVFASAWISTWRDLPPPGRPLHAIPDPPCGEAGHSGTTRHCAQCASERLAGDRP